MTASTRFNKRIEAGFTLVEIIVAMGVLLVGMTGIFSLFATALGLQREATERMDTALNLPSIMSEVENEVAIRFQDPQKGPDVLNGAVFPVPGNAAYRYRLTVEPMPDDPEGRAFFCRIEILARYRGQERVYDMGYRPIIPEPDNEARIRQLLGASDGR
jgi:prepilin-type N-terminal cleavage/methylation domain-containing protein